jgi:hypothetical protein
MPIEARWRSGAAPAGGKTTVVAVLPSGRVAWLRLAPALAPASATNDLLRQVERSSDRRDFALERQADAVERLRDRVAADSDRLGRDRLARARRLRRRLATTYARLDKRLVSENTALNAAAEQHEQQMREYTRRLGNRAFWDRFTVATSAPLFAAYGTRDNPFSVDNLALTLSLLVWLVGDEVVQALFAPKNEEPDALREPDIWSFLSPIGNVFAGWWLEHDRQHDRFVSGIASLLPPGTAASAAARRAATGGATGPGAILRRLLASPSLPLPARPAAFDDGPPQTEIELVARVDLTPFIAPDYQDDFGTFIGVPAVAGVSRLTVADGLPDGTAVQVSALTATVEGLCLSLTATVTATAPTGASLDPALLTTAVGALDVAWLVDTQEPCETTSTD